MRTISLLLVSAAAALSHAASNRVVGYVGDTKVAVQIYAAPSSKARVRAHLGAGKPLIVNSQGAKWDAVIMIDGHLGYVPAANVALRFTAGGKPYPFTEAQVMAVIMPTRLTASLGSRGGFVRGGSNDARSQMVASALSLEGTTPYKWGGNELGSGIDCSGFVKKMYGAIGYSLPRTAAEQSMVGIPINRYEDLRPGDRLYFYDAKRGRIGHTGIYAGGGYFVHSSSGHHGIAHDFLSERWRRICVAARR